MRRVLILLLIFSTMIFFGTSNVFAASDTDHDGLYDDVDRDDDNDGIPDANESIPFDCTTAPHPLFGSAQGPHSEGGSNVSSPHIGDKFRYENVYTGVDAIVYFESASAGVTINTVDSTSGGSDSYFQPVFNQKEFPVSLLRGQYRNLTYYAKLIA